MPAKDSPAPWMLTLPKSIEVVSAMFTEAAWRLLAGARRVGRVVVVVVNEDLLEAKKGADTKAIFLVGGRMRRIGEIWTGDDA